ncbi:MAG: cytochrome c biogenesis protein CcsA [Microscillaceae bacterium]|nr:cytochrome c biogenesis protein CcsA [Microscillaceae bacterium]MDW8459745.1 cytochrome c biogenesis protein CcsA [Cytophagales bacterium]
MINTTLGNIGHLSVIVAFVASLVSFYAYLIATLAQQKQNLPLEQSWKRFARISFYVHSLAVVSVITTLFIIIYQHRYEYYYAWSHSSKNLPVYYMISCFWEGQEGSFLLWIFWHVLLGIVLIHTNKFWENSVMTVFALVQAFLTSMILGVVFFNTFKVGSSPFILMREAMDVPIFKLNSNFIPEDGKGLNPLLQNYWMIIHPPTLFMGFAATLVPFAYCIAGLWLRQYREWVRPALPWALFAAAVLGLGILMGGYWAYETLNFGGYWNWDPVENAVYVPWLVLVASIHTMISFKNSSKALKTAMILVISTFILILYATFLTRSGILGNASVHSFTDLGLSGQLLLYLLVFAALSKILLIIRWKEIPITREEISTYSREFWVFMGVLTLCLAGFQVLFTTSIPVYNKIAESMGFILNIALPANQVEHYTKFQLWFAILIALLSGTGQFFWWKKIDKATLQRALAIPLTITFLATALGITLAQIQKPTFMLLLLASIYTIVANATILLNMLRKQTFKLTGGAIAHMGIGLMLIGILFSAGYSKVISKNTTGLLYSKEFPDEMNTDNILLWLNQPTKMGDYYLTYSGTYLDAKKFPTYLKKSWVIATSDPNKVIAKQDIHHEGKTYFKQGDTIQIYPENTYYKVDYRDKQGRVFSLFPRAQINPTMGLLASPDIKRELTKDLYTHVSSIPDPTQEKEWSKTEEHKVALKDTFFLNDYVAVLDKIERLNASQILNPIGMKEQLTEQDAAVQAHIRLLGKEKTFEVRPTFYIKGQMIGRLPEIIEELGVKITFLNILPNENKFVFGVNTTQKDYIIMKAVEKPLINILWIGTLLVMIGFSVAIYRRYAEFMKIRNKGMEVQTPVSQHDKTLENA